jgi:ATP-binding cassette, subfamily C, bacterial PrsD
MAVFKLKGLSDRAPVEAALAKSRGAFLAVAGFSGVINIAMLSGSIYMLQVYDRALPSRSVPTLIGLTVLLLVVSLLQGFLDGVRGRMMTRIGARFDQDLSSEAYTLSRKLPLRGARLDQAAQPLRDLDQIRAFLSGLGPTAFFDLPWMPIFFVGCFIIHPWLGYLAFVGGFFIVALALISEKRSHSTAQAQVQSGVRRQSFADASRRCAEAISAMGMGNAFKRRFAALNSAYVNDGLSAVDSTASISAFAKIFRQVLQSAVLGLGAYLVMQGQMSAGAMIAASIMTSRALAPLETVVAHWKPFMLARESYRRLNDIMARARANPDQMELPNPQNNVTISDLAVGVPGAQKPLVQGIDFTLKAGQGLCIIGPSASGKSTLVRALVGIWKPMRGDIRIDGAALNQWNEEQLGKAVGYLPQEIELFEGTIAENISRFDETIDPDSIHAAAKALIQKFAMVVRHCLVANANVLAWHALFTAIHSLWFLMSLTPTWTRKVMHLSQKRYVVCAPEVGSQLWSHIVQQPSRLLTWLPFSLTEK